MDILAINKDTLTDDNINEIINKYYAHKQKKAVYSRTYQKTHADKLNKYNLEQYYKNREKILKQKKEYYERKKKEKEEQQQA